MSYALYNSDCLLDNISADEYEVLLKIRAAKEKEKKRKAIPIDILFLAYDYLKWLRDNGAGDTYSTFCDDYGRFNETVQDSFFGTSLRELQRKNIHEWVMKIIAQVNMDVPYYVPNHILKSEVPNEKKSV